MACSSRRRRRSEEGASAVEFALVVPLLVMLLLGVTTAGMGVNNALGTTDAVRARPRYGATTATSPAPSGYASWSAAVQAKTLGLSAGSVTNVNQVCRTLQKGPSTVLQQSSCSFSGSAPATPTSVTSTDCVVKVWAR